MNKRHAVAADDECLGLVGAYWNVIETHFSSAISLAAAKVW